LQSTQGIEHPEYFSEVSTIGYECGEIVGDIHGQQRFRGAGAWPRELQVAGI
jgi:hypothetical protein